jgi:hypothetical protein
MAIVKANFTKDTGGAKASVRYIQHRPGIEGASVTRTLFGSDGLMGRYEAYRMIDEAQQGSRFFRFVFSPDPHGEDTHQDLNLRVITEHIMQQLEDRLQQSVTWVGVQHADHAPHRHVHVVAVVTGRLNAQDFQALRQAATEACLQQRRERDLVLNQQVKAGEEAQWGVGY